MRSRIRLVQQTDGHTLAEEDGMRTAYAAHGGELYRFALRALGERGAAEDVVQETFLRAWKAADRYDAALSSLRVWLFAIARNVVIDQARRRRGATWARVSSEADGVQAAMDPVPDQTDQLVSTWLVEAALAQLTQEHRYVIVETYLRGRSYANLAAESGVPVGTLRSRTFYALKALRIAMDEMGVNP